LEDANDHFVLGSAVYRCHETDELDDERVEQRPKPDNQSDEERRHQPPASQDDHLDGACDAVHEDVSAAIMEHLTISPPQKENGGRGAHLAEARRCYILASRGAGTHMATGSIDRPERWPIPGFPQTSADERDRARFTPAAIWVIEGRCSRAAGLLTP